jgi:hypothetical protein
MHDLQAPVACATGHGLELLSGVAAGGQTSHSPAPALGPVVNPRRETKLDLVFNPRRETKLDLVFNRLPGAAHQWDAGLQAARLDDGAPVDRAFAPADGPIERACRPIVIWR